MSAARDRFLALLQGKVGPPPFLPLLEPIAPRVAGSPPEQLAQDPAAWSAAVAQSARLLKADAVTIGFDPALAVEACRAVPDAPETHPAMAVYLDAANRLFSVERNNLGCIAALCGPASLWQATAPGEDEKAGINGIKAPLTRLMEAMCRHRPDLVVLVEQAGALADPPSPDLRRIYGTMRRVTAYYGVALGLQTPGPNAPASLGCDLLFQADGEGSLPKDWRAVVAAVTARPDAAMAACRRLLAERAAGGPALGFGLAGLTADTPMDELRSTSAAILALAA